MKERPIRVLIGVFFEARDGVVGDGGGGVVVRALLDRLETRIVPPMRLRIEKASLVPEVIRH